MSFAGGRIDALVLCSGEVLRSADPQLVEFGIAQVRRLLVSESLHVLHVVFAPFVPRPLLLGLVRLENRTPSALRVDYTEIWEGPAGLWHSGPGACERRGDACVWALADAAHAVRASPFEPPPRAGLGLEVRLGLPPRARRQLSFAYVAVPPDESAAALVRAWRGEVAAELERAVRAWLELLDPAEQLVAAYRERVATLGE